MVTCQLNTVEMNKPQSYGGHVSTFGRKEWWGAQLKVESV
jgi:hypothetical protein